MSCRTPGDFNDKALIAKFMTPTVSSGRLSRKLEEDKYFKYMTCTQMLQIPWRMNGNSFVEPNTCQLKLWSAICKSYILRLGNIAAFDNLSQLHSSMIQYNLIVDCREHSLGSRVRSHAETCLSHFSYLAAYGQAKPNQQLSSAFSRDYAIKALVCETCVKLATEHKKQVYLPGCCHIHLSESLCSQFLPGPDMPHNCNCILQKLTNDYKR